MHESNLQRMIRLAEEFFETKNDPAQISINDQSIEKLKKIHRCTMTEERDEEGPIAWILVIPTTHELMERFITKGINEQELLENTPVGGTYDALYLCSALVVPEYRGKGMAKRLVIGAVRSIQEQHPIRTLFYWAFSVEGEKLAASIAGEFGLPLHRRPA